VKYAEGTPLAVAAMRRLGEACRNTAALVTEWLEAGRLEDRRIAHGGNAGIARKHPDRYLTACCQASLCQAVGFSCKSDVYGLQCHCKCHA